MDRRRFIVDSSGALLGVGLQTHLGRTEGEVFVEPGAKVFTWERGIAIESRAVKDMAMFLWFYEWTMFAAVNPGEHTLGRFEDFQRSANRSQSEATTADSQFRLAVQATDLGANLILEVTNKSDHDWPSLAAIIPCLSPGLTGPNLNLNERRGSAEGNFPARNPAFDNQKTFFLGPSGLELLHQRELHFSNKCRHDIDAAMHDGGFAFSQKWPTATPDATGGLILRESTDGGWVSGIAWEDFLSVQAHNPWRCMHLAPRVGPLKQNESKVVRGKIYLFKGTKEDCLRHYWADFS